MTTKRKILELLEEKSGLYISGQQIAEQLNISRSAVWKSVNALCSEGYLIEAVRNKGYRLVGVYDELDEKCVLTQLESKDFYKIKIFDILDSTNTALMRKAADGAPHGLVYCARSQQNGKGRLGRSFLSQSRNGLYFSILLRPALCPENAAFLTTLAAVAVCRAIEKCSTLSPKIKWVNDIFINGKKVCGILTQASFSVEDSFVEYAVVGIGINVYPPICGFDKSICDVAGAVFENNGQCTKSRLLALVLDEFASLYAVMDDKKYIMRQYRARCFVIGKNVTVCRGNEAFNAVVCDIDDDCALIVKRDDGESVRLVSGEISIRI